MANKSYYTFIHITAPEPRTESLKAFARKINEQFETLTMKFYGNIEMSDFHESVSKIINSKVGKDDFNTSITQTQEQISLLATKQEVTNAVDNLSGQISGILDVIDGKTTIFYQEAEPSGAVVNDVWYDTDAYPVSIKRKTALGWTDITTEALSLALANAADAQAVADQKIRCFSQAEPPSGMLAEDEGDLWIDSNDNNKLYRWSGTGWVSARDGMLEIHANDIAGLFDAVDKKTTVFYQDEQPASPSDGDVWYDTNADPVVVYRWNGTAWSDVTTPSLSAALQAAGDAQATADGKVRTFAQNEPPSGMVNGDVGDLWIDTNDSNKLYRYSGSAWVAVQDTHNDALLSSHSSSISAINSNLGKKTTIFYQNGEPTPTAVGDVWYDTDATPSVIIYRWTGSFWANITTKALNQALTAAADAMAVADGKINSYAQAEPPTGLTSADVGDLWIDTNDDNKLYRYTGSTWAVVQDTHNDAALSANANAITSLAGAVNAKTTVFYQNEQPTATATGDVWYDVDASPVQIYRWTGTGWDNVTTDSLSQALAAAGTAQSTADGKIRCFYQNDAPTGMVAGDVGDLWVDSNDNNKLYRYSGTEWVAVQDTHLDQIVSTHTTQISEANGAIALKANQSTVDTLTGTVASLSSEIDLVPGMITAEVENSATYIGPTPPASPFVGRHWIDSANTNELLYWKGVVTETSRRYAAFKEAAAVRIDDLDGSDDMPLDVTVKTVAKQAGTGDPSPTNIRAITPAVAAGGNATVKRCGKNMLVADMALGSPGWASNANSSLTLASKDGIPCIYSIKSISHTPIRLDWDTWYTYSCRIMFEQSTVSAGKLVPLHCWVGRYETGGTSGIAQYISSQSPGMTYEANVWHDLCVVFKTGPKTTFPDPIYIHPFIYSGDLMDNNKTFWLQSMQIEASSEVTPYEPYSGVDFSLPVQNAMYGVTGAEDERGSDGHETHKTRYCAFNGGEGVSGLDVIGATVRVIYSIPGLGLPLSVANASAISSHFPKLYNPSYDSPHFYLEDNVFVLFIPRVLLSDTSIAAVQAWLYAQASAGTPVQIVYQLATPTALTNSATPITGVDGTNTVTSNGSKVKVAYTGSGWGIASTDAKRLFASAKMKFDETGLEITQESIDGTPAATKYKANTHEYGLFRVSDGKMLQGAKVLPDSRVAGASSVMVDPDGDNNAYYEIETSGSSVHFTMVHGTHSGPGPTDEPDFDNIPITAWRKLIALGASVAPGWVPGEYLDEIHTELDASGTSFAIYGDQIYVSALDETGQSKCGMSFDAERDSAIRIWGVVYAQNSIRPQANGSYNLGSSDLKWKYVYSNNSLQTSDEREKRDFAPIDKALDFIMALKPFAYRYIFDPDDSPMRMGVGAQSTDAALNNCGMNGYAVVNRDDPDHLSMAYTEFIAPHVLVTQQHEQRLNAQDVLIDGLKQELQAQRNRNDELERRLAALEATIGGTYERRSHSSRWINGERRNYH